MTTRPDVARPTRSYHTLAEGKAQATAWLACGPGQQRLQPSRPTISETRLHLPTSISPRPTSVLRRLCPAAASSATRPTQRPITASTLRACTSSPAANLCHGRPPLRLWTGRVGSHPQRPNVPRSCGGSIGFQQPRRTSASIWSEMDARVKGALRCVVVDVVHGGDGWGRATVAAATTTVTLRSVMKEGSLASVPK
jgi:hypothetical protein